MLCGECKRRAAELLAKWLSKHQEKLEKAREIAKSLNIEPDF